MPISAQLLWDVLTAAGGSLALTLIVGIAVGIGAMTLLFVGSAIVALERFARTVRSSRSALLAGGTWAAVASAGFLASTAPELADQGTAVWLGSWAASTASGLVLVAIVWIALQRLSAWRLASATTAALGVGYGLLIGGGGHLAYAAAPALFCGVTAAALSVRRRARSAGAPPGEAERLIRILTVALAAAGLVGLAAPAPEGVASASGVAVIGFFLVAVLIGLLPLAAAGLLQTRHNFEWFIAVRYLFAKRRQTFISVITGICVLGIAAGVWLIITVLSVMNGFERTWRDEIIGNRAHFTVHSGLGPFSDYGLALDKVSEVPGVVAASPYLDVEGMVRGNAGEIMGVRLRGVKPDLVGNVTDLRDDLIEGSLDALEAGAEERENPPIVIGSQLSGALGVGVGDPLLLISPFGGPQTPLGPAPRLKRFEVAGIFESSFFQYDEMFTYVNLADAQDFRRTGDVVDGIEVRTTDFYRSQQVADDARNALGFPYYTRDWKEFFPAFFQALKSERVMMFVLLTMIMVVAAFAIVSTLVMMIMEKSSDIAILKAMGAEDDAIERIFAIEGTLIGLVGTALGVVGGISVTAKIAWIQEQIEALFGIDTLPASVYQFSTLPAELDAGQIAVAVAIAMILALGATLLPSRQGARLDPVEALRYE